MVNDLSVVLQHRLEFTIAFCGEFPDNAHPNNAHADDVFPANQIRELKSASTFQTLLVPKSLPCNCSFNVRVEENFVVKIQHMTFNQYNHCQIFGEFY